MSRTEVFHGTGPTSGTHIKVKMGATNDGKITAAEANLIYEAGAFPGSPVPSGCRTMFGPYDIANAYIEGLDVVINASRFRRRVIGGRTLRRYRNGSGGIPATQRF